MAVAGIGRSSEIYLDGRWVSKFPGMAAGFTADRIPQVILSTGMSWSSTATKKSFRLVPFNFTAVDLAIFLQTKPTGSAAKRLIQVGTVTSASLFFVTGNYYLNSATTTGLKIKGSATNFKTTQADCAATVVQFTLPPTATAIVTAGLVYAGLVVVAR